MEAGLTLEEVERRGVEDPGPAPGEEVGAEREEGGLGLGLLLCRALVRRAGGHIDVDRAGPTGKRFAVRLPVTPV